MNFNITDTAPSYTYTSTQGKLIKVLNVRATLLADRIFFEEPNDYSASGTCLFYFSFHSFRNLPYDSLNMELPARHAAALRHSTESITTK
jgi:hypothetical protein